MKFAILCHWHTGSSLLAKTFRACGMEVGNKKTFWDPHLCDPQCEHSYLNGLGNDFLMGNIGKSSFEFGVRKIVESYVSQAKAHKWEHYGVKVTHAVQSQTWPVFRKAFLDIWGEDTIFVTTKRNSGAIIESTKDPLWPADKVMKSWMSSIPAIVEIVSMKNGVGFTYPTDWYNGNLCKIVQDLGLPWTPEAENLFDPLRPREADSDFRVYSKA